MGKFILQSILFSILLIAGYWFIASHTSLSRGNYYGFSFGYMSGLKIKHQRAKEITQPKITENGKLTERFMYLQDYVDGK